MEINKLLEEFPRDQVTFRPGSTNRTHKKAPLSDADVKGATALPLAYIDARDVMDRLDKVCGANNWKDEYEFHGNRTICRISIWLEVGGSGEWVSKCDGAGDTNMEGEKGGISDAFKRAAVKWGVGRYLYKLRFNWAPINKRKRFDEKLVLWDYLKTKDVKPETKAKPKPVKAKVDHDDVAKRLMAAVDNFTASGELLQFEKDAQVYNARAELPKKLSKDVDDHIKAKHLSFNPSPSQAQGLDNA